MSKIQLFIIFIFWSEKERPMMNIRGLKTTSQNELSLGSKFNTKVYFSLV